MTTGAVPLFTAPEARMRSTFLAMMWALSYPGSPNALPVQTEELDSLNPFEAIAESLLDLETCYYTPDEGLAAYCARMTARAEAPDRAEYLFFPVVNEHDLATIATASVGTMLYPDQAATFILGGQLGKGVTLDLSGPGIQGETTINIGGLPAAFWNLRNQARRFPLGWDIFVVAGTQVVGLPRSTMITVK